MPKKIVDITRAGSKQYSLREKNRILSFTVIIMTYCKKHRIRMIYADARAMAEKIFESGQKLEVWKDAV